MTKRINELTKQRSDHQAKATSIVNWLMEHQNHADKSKYVSDRNYHLSMVEKLTKKIENLTYARPENGIGNPSFLETNINTIKR